MLTYNRQHLVGRAIESILAQTFNDFQFIIVDNGSTDKSGAICDSYAQKDDRLHVMHRHRGTIGSGRNSGLDVACGDYITFIDDDDYAEPQMLEFLYTLAEKYGADIALCGSYKIIDGKREDNFVYEDLLLMDAAQAVIEYLKRQRFNAAMPTKLLKHHLLDEIRFQEEGHYDDIVVGYRYLAKADRVAALGKPLYSFYRHQTNNSTAATSEHMLNPQQLEEYLAAFRQRTEYLSTQLPETADYAQYSEWSYMISMYDKISRNKLIDCYPIREKIGQILRKHYNDFCNGPYIASFEHQWMEQYLSEGAKADG